MITVNTERGFHVLGTLVNQFRLRKPPFDTAKLPQKKEFLPQSIEWGSLEHARFLFCVCYYMRGGINSYTAIKNLTQLYDYQPLYFDPAYTSTFGEREQTELALTLKNSYLGYQHLRNSQYWVVNSRKLHRFWDDDPRSFYASVESYDELCNIVIGKMNKRKIDEPHGFMGFRYKMTSMLTYFFEDAGIISCPFVYPVPVDFHVLRILTSNEVLKNGGGEVMQTDELSKYARELTVLFCMEENVTTMELSNALWLYSNNMCNRHPGNVSLVSKLRKGRSTDIRPRPYEWTRAKIKAYESTCGICPINDTCMHHAPAGPYYVHGNIHLRGKRDSPPQQYLPLKY